MSNLKNALRELSRLTRGSFNIFDLAGDYGAGNRQAIMLDLTGGKLPKSKCGVNALRDRFFSEAGKALDGANCDSARQELFKGWARDTLGLYPFSTPSANPFSAEEQKAMGPFFW